MAVFTSVCLSYSLKPTNNESLRMKQKKIHVCLLLLLPIFFLSCAKLPISEVKYSEYKKIAVGSGPEDMVLDTFSASIPRLLVSCNERRIKNSDFGEIYSVDLQNEKAEILPRKNNPVDLAFRPHGIDLVKNISGEILLYCVSHNEKKKEHSIIIYKIFPDRLEFQQKLDSPLLVSPNDVAATSSGEFFVTNDSGKRGSKTEPMLKLKRSNVVMYVENNYFKNPNDGEWKKNPVWQIAADKLSYANGVVAGSYRQIYVSTVTGNQLLSYTQNEKGNNFGEKKVIAKLKGLDNISFVNENEILVTSHPSLYKFLKHFKNSKKKSPSVVYKVNLKTGEVKNIFSDDGSQISGASTAVSYNGKLYISQVFEPFLLECR